jgi:hypothetical protein
VDADHRLNLVVIGRHLGVAQHSHPSTLAHPLLGRSTLALTAGDEDVATKPDDVLEVKLLLEKPVQLGIAEATIGHDRHLDRQRDHLTKPEQQLVLMVVALVSQLALDDRLPDQRRGPAMLGLQTGGQHGLVIVVKVGPVEVDNDFSAPCHDEGHPELEEVVHVDLGVADEAVDLLGGVALDKSLGCGEAASDGVNGQRARNDDACGGVGDGHDPLGVDVLVKKGVDELLDHSGMGASLASPVGHVGDDDPKVQ